MAETLLNAHNPLRLFASSFDLHVIQPFLECQRNMQIENANRERLIIKQLDSARFHAQYLRDVKWGLLHVNKAHVRDFVGEPAYENGGPPVGCLGPPDETAVCQ